MSLSEKDVEARFIGYLIERGWVIEKRVPGDYTDLIARRGSELLVCELKGVTLSPETAINIGYGQILRAMSRYPDATYGLVVPEALRSKVERVSLDVRHRLSLNVYLVPEVGEIRMIQAESTDPGSHLI